MSDLKRYLALIVVLAVMGASGQAQDLIPWASNLETARHMASRQNQLVLIHFWTPGCVPCRRLENTVFNQPTVAHVIGQSFVPVKIDASQFPETARQFGVDRFPTDVIITPAGQIVGSMTSPSSAEQYINETAGVAARHFGVTAQNAASQLNQITQGISQATNQAAQRIQEEVGQLPPSATGVSATGVSATGVSATGVSATGVSATGVSATGGNSLYGLSTTTALPNSPAPPVVASVSNGYGQPTQQTSQIIIPEGTRPRSGKATYDVNNDGRPFSNGSQQGQTYAPGGTGPNVSNSPVQPPQYSADQLRPRNPSVNALATPSGRWGQNTSGSVQGYATTTTDSGQATPTAKSPRLGLEGYSPVALTEQTKWVKGDPRWGVVHRGNTYLFMDELEQQRFLKEPDRFAPKLSGFDPVEYVEKGQLLPGRRQHGVFYQHGVYLFTSEHSLQLFWNSPDRYVVAVEQAIQRTAHRSIR